MRLQTDEADDNLDANFVIDFLAMMMRREIKNMVQYHNNELLVNLSDRTTALITAPKVSRDTLPPEQTEATIHNLATWRYVMQHDYGYGDNYEHTVLNKLLLHDIDECRTYVEDAVGSQLNAYFTNYLIEFMNGEKFLLAVELKQ